jgi:hypothetical protein
MSRRITSPQDLLDQIVAVGGTLGPPETYTPTGGKSRPFPWDEVNITPTMIDDLREREGNLRRLRVELEHRMAGQARICDRPGCETVVYGRADRRYCSTTCRVAAHRSRTRPLAGPG